jgi:glycosyltransferase involved in cell wall biosynthesis
VGLRGVGLEDTKKRVAVIGVKGLPGFGGAARAMESLIGSLKPDYDITVYAIASHTKMQGRFDGYYQIVFQSNKNRLLNTFFYYWKSLLHCLFMGNYDLVHINHGPSGYIVPFLKLKYPVLMTLHGVYDEERYDEKFSGVLNRAFRVFQLAAFKFADVLVSVSRHEMDYVKRHTTNPVIHIPNGVSVKDVDCKGLVPYKDYLLFCAARIYAIKGCDVFLRALKDISYQGKVLIIGDMGHDPKHGCLLKELAKNLDVTFLDLIKDKALLMAYLKNAKLFVFPSRMEGMSNMLLEAAAMGCPIVCSDIRANAGVFTEDEVTFFKSGDFHDLGQKIVLALENREDIREMAERARKMVENEYSWDRVAQQYQRLYEALIRKGDLQNMGSGIATEENRGTQS